ncbi:MAG TPA: metalloregulator ArsR/SmtB family transcription factor [Terriglobales bacterium]|nr:metalloregulator ArsR/SmtB family transcription factor [Terriglobales bacterium]
MRRNSSPPAQQRFFRALADHTRLRLLNLMGENEVCVCYFVAVLKLSQPKISRHLAYLRRAGIVGARRQGKWMHYRLLVPSETRAAHILHDTLAWLSLDPAMQRDAARLVRACCHRQVFVQLQGAPLPGPIPVSTPAAQGERIRP